MKKSAAALIALAIIALFCFLGMPNTGCSVSEEKAASTVIPALAPATRATEAVETKLDTAADKAKPAVDAGQKLAEGAAGLGIPYAGAIRTILGLVSFGLGKYHERRTGTTPLNTALAQVVQSVETAFPNKTPEQKTALAAVQDQATKNLVTQIKGT